MVNCDVLKLVSITFIKMLLIISSLFCCTLYFKITHYSSETKEVEGGGIFHYNQNTQNSFTVPNLQISCKYHSQDWQQYFTNAGNGIQ
jgi:hypothetical protein